jgi:hypothetical protein
MPKPTVLVALALFAGCQTVPDGAPRPGQVEHIVLVWLNEPGNAAIKERLVATTRSFPAQIDGIVALSIGDALPSDRDVVDDTFDLALVIRFVNKAALDAYEVHPAHQQAVKDVLAPNVRRIVVHDSMLR